MGHPLRKPALPAAPGRPFAPPGTSPVPEWFPGGRSPANTNIEIPQPARLVEPLPSTKPTLPGVGMSRGLGGAFSVLQVLALANAVQKFSDIPKNLEWMPGPALDDATRNDFALLMQEAKRRFGSMSNASLSQLERVRHEQAKEQPRRTSITPDSRQLWMEDQGHYVQVPLGTDNEEKVSPFIAFLKHGFTPMRERARDEQLLIEAEKTRRLLVVDLPPDGKSVTQWLAEMEQKTRILLLIAALQAAALYHKKNGRSDLARQTEGELNTLFAQVSAISTTHPGFNRIVQAMNSASGAALALVPAANADGNASDKDASKDPKLVPDAKDLVDLGGIWAVGVAADPEAKSSPFFDFAVPRDQASLAGKALILVGGVNFGRNFLLSEPLRIAAALGMRLLLVEQSGRRPAVVPPENFIAAPIFEHSAAAMAYSVNAVTTAVAERGLEVAGVAAYFNPFVELAAMIRSSLRQNGAMITGDGSDAVATANSKHLARERMATYAPDVAVPYAAFTCAATDLPRAQREAREAFMRITGGDPNKRVVMKPITAAAKVGVLLGIASADEAAEAIVAIDKDIRALMGTEYGQSLSVDAYTGIMMEEQLGGATPSPEVDVEVMLGANSGLAFVIGNPRAKAPWQQERGFTLPSPLSDDDQRALVAGALRALKAMGLRWGNFHVEMILTPEGPRVVEFNTRMGGGPIFLLTRDIWGLNLMEQGARGFLGLSLQPPTQRHHEVVIARYLLPGSTGVIADIQGADLAAQAPGILDVKLKKHPGDEIVAPWDGIGNDNFGWVTGTGRDYGDARQNVLSAMRLFRFDVRRSNGETTFQLGDHGNNEPEYETWSHD